MTTSARHAVTGPATDGQAPLDASLSVLMPVYNERETVETAIAQTLEADMGVTDVELVIVDDGSTDGTREILRAGDWPEGVHIHYHDRNRGKGAAVITALQHAQGDYAAIMDADLEYEPGEIGKLLHPLVVGDADAVFGARGFESHTSFNFWYVMGNRFVTLCANVIYNKYVTDIMTCHKVIPTETFRALNLREPGFAIEPEITARLMRRGSRIYEIPVVYKARAREDGKKLTAVDGLRVVRTLLRCRFDRG